MADAPKVPAPRRELTPGEVVTILSLGALGIIAVIVAVYIGFFTDDWRTSSVTKAGDTTTTVADYKTAVTSLGAAGVFFILIAALFDRVTKISFAGFTLETSSLVASATKKAQEAGVSEDKIPAVVNATVGKAISQWWGPSPRPPEETVAQYVQAARREVGA